MDVLPAKNAAVCTAGGLYLKDALSGVDELELPPDADPGMHELQTAARVLLKELPPNTDTYVDAQGALYVSSDEWTNRLRVKTPYNDHLKLPLS